VSSSAWLRWLNKPLARRRDNRGKLAARPPRFLPRLEPLEDRVTPSSADLMVTKTDNTTGQQAVPGTAIIYTVTVTNAGPDDVTGASVIDNLPAALTNASFTAVGTGGASGFTASGNGSINDTAVNLPNGDSVTYTVTGTIKSGAVGTLVNTATAATPAGVTDTDANNSTATDTVTLTPQADLQVVKSAPPTVTAGTPFAFTLTVTNNGPSDAHSVTLSDLVPSGATFIVQAQTGGTAAFTLSNTGNQITDTIATLPAGGTATITVLAGAKVSAAHTTLMNTATVGSTTPDPTPGNNTSQANTNVIPPVIVTSATLPPGKVGVAYKQTFTTTGGTAPYTYHIVGTVPPGITFSVPTTSLVISGTPRAPGTFHFTITTTDVNKFTGVQSFTLTVKQGNLARLVFLTQPGPGPVNGFLPSFRVAAVDQFGNPLTGVTVKLALIPVLTQGSGSFIGGSVLQAVTVNGIATFSRVGLSARGVYRLEAFSAGGFLAFSNNFSVGLDGRHSPFPR
jgi:uncharacterized repeat protein (TIGR01451 family)